MSTEREQEIAARVEKATSGPWEVLETRSDPTFVAGMVEPTSHVIERRIVTGWIHGQLKTPYGVVNSNVSVCAVNGVKPHHGVSISPEDSAFIAHAREDIPYLLEQLASERTTRHAIEQEHVNLTRLREQAISISLMLGQAMGEQGTLTECVRRLIDAKEAAEAKLSQLRDLLRSAEWSATIWTDTACCPFCGATKDGLPEVPGFHKAEPANTHRPDCELEAALKESA